MTTHLPVPTVGGAESWVREHLGHLACDEVRASSAFTGGQTAADIAAAAYDVTGYARRRSQVWPPSSRGASALSPWIRHGLLPLPRMWDEVAGGPASDVRKYRDELLWQEYARHVYARLGSALGEPLRAVPSAGAAGPQAEDEPREDPWNPQMRCMDSVTHELEDAGWLVNQTRMWLASQWTVRHGADWRAGEDAMFTHLLDGSRAANRLGWQWTTGTGNAKPYGFSRWQVEKRAATWCRKCELRDECPIEDWPDASVERIEPDPRIARDPDIETTAGPTRVLSQGSPQVVWLTAESLGDEDPALAANPDLPVVFVFDEPLLRGLQLSGKRLVFLAQCLGDLATRREVEVHLGDPAAVLADRDLATTFAPVPGWRRRAPMLRIIETHPWPWLRLPHARSIQSFSAWRKSIR